MPPPDRLPWSNGGKGGGMLTHIAKPIASAATATAPRSRYFDFLVIVSVETGQYRLGGAGLFRPLVA